MQDTCMEISEAMLRRSGEQAVLYPPPPLCFISGLTAALQVHQVKRDAGKKYKNNLVNMNKHAVA